MPNRSFANQASRNFLQTHLEIPALLALLDIGDGLRMLEVGCGAGVALTRLAKLCRPARLVGLDVDKIQIALASDRLGGTRAELRRGDVREMPFAAGEFDVVLDFGTCYHIDEPERALREIARVLREGGRFVHETPLAQLLAHPIRSSGRTLPWSASSELKVERRALLWNSRRKSAAA